VKTITAALDEVENYVKEFVQREQTVRGAVGNVLCNASNFPETVQARLLGQDMEPLIDKVTQAVLAAKGPKP
jgi:hypothetical protein